MSSQRFSLPAQHSFDTSAFPIHYQSNASQSSTPTAALLTLETMTEKRQDQSPHRNVCSLRLSISTIIYFNTSFRITGHPHFVKVDKERDEDRSSTSLNIFERFSEFVAQIMCVSKLSAFGLPLCFL